MNLRMQRKLESFGQYGFVRGSPGEQDCKEEFASLFLQVLMSCDTFVLRLAPPLVLHLKACERRRG